MSNTKYLPGDMIICLAELRVRDIAVGYMRDVDFRKLTPEETKERLEDNGNRIGASQEVTGFGPEVDDVHIKDVHSSETKLWIHVKNRPFLRIIVRARATNETSVAAKVKIADYPSICKLCGQAAYEGAFGVIHAIEPSPCTAARV